MNDSPLRHGGAAPSKGEVTVIELDRRERMTARRGAETRAVVPNVEFSAEVDIGATLARDGELECGTTALLVRACAHALGEIPRANGAYRDGRVELYSRVNIGVTIADQGVYEIPTVFDADSKSAGEIALELSLLAQRAREGELTAPETSGATFTMTDSVAFGIATMTPLIMQPQAAALAAGPVRDVPVIRDGSVVAGQTMVLTLAADHRILYGAYAAGFLEAVKAHLERATP